MDDDLRTFLIESNDLINRVEEYLLSAEAKKEYGLKDIVSAFGNIHSIKGNAMYLNFSALIAACQKAESFLSNNDRSPKIPSDKEFDLLFKFVDAVRDLFRNLERDSSLEIAQSRLNGWLKQNEYQAHPLPLDRRQKDIVIEFFNMGTSKAASAFNQLLACLVKLEVFGVEIYSGEDDLFKLGVLEQGHYCLSQQSFYSVFTGSASIIIPKEDAGQMTEALTGINAGQSDFDGALQEMVKEIGNILTNHAFGSVSNVLDQLIDYTVPVFHEGQLFDLVNSKIDFSNPKEHCLIVSKLKFGINALAGEKQLIILIKVKAVENFLSAVEAKSKVRA